MHLGHKGGDKMFIDYANDKQCIIDYDTGEILPATILMAILPCSQLIYVEAVMGQREERLIRACTLPLLWWSPLVIVPDNLKAAVKKSSQ